MPFSFYLPLLIFGLMSATIRSDSRLNERSPWLAAKHGTRAQDPAVTKVDPPDWWVGAHPQTIQLLVRGHNLHGAVVTAQRGVSLSHIRVNERGTYLLADLTIPQNAKPGQYGLRFRTAHGETTIPFSLTKSLPPSENAKGFAPDDVIYLILPDRFCDGDPANNDPVKSRGLYDPKQTRFYHGGDFAGIRKKLPYLKDLGVTALWLAPIYDNADKADPTRVYDGQENIDYHGYGAVDYYGVEEHFGTLAELKALVQDAHRHGIKVIQDQVCNHIGGFHPWVHDPPTSTWLHGTPENHLSCDWNVPNLMNPYASAETWRATLDGWFAGLLPDMNQDDPDAARYLIQHSLWWVGQVGFDGIRQDTLPYVPRSFWRDWTAALKRDFPSLTILGEVNELDPALVAFFQGGRKAYDGIDTGVDTLFDYGLYGAIKKGFSGDKPTLKPIQNMLGHDWLYLNPNVLVPFLSLHDVPCFMSLPGATQERLRVALTLLLTIRGTPMLYFGDEIGLPGAGDPINRRHFPGGFPGDERDAFTAEGRTPEEEKTFQHVRRLTTLRAATPALRHGRMQDLYLAEAQYVYARTLPDRQMAIVALNVGDTPVTITVNLKPVHTKAAAFTDRIGGGKTTVRQGKLSLHLEPMSAQVLAVE